MQPIKKELSFALFGAVLLVAASASFAEVVSSPAYGDISAPVLELQQRSSMLDQPTAQVRFYSNGNVEAEYPRVHKLAGIHNFKIDQSLLESLLVQALDAYEQDNLVAETVAGSPSSSTLFYVSDPTYTDFTIRVESYANGASRQRVPAPITINKKDLAARSPHPGRNRLHEAPEGSASDIKLFELEQKILNLAFERIDSK